jgi:hypothetical protein
MNEAPMIISTLVNLLSAKPDGAAGSLAKLITDGSFNNSNGKFFNNKLKEIKSNEYSHDKKNQDRLWDISLKLVGADK